jgi:hypothetical protein
MITQHSITFALGSSRTMRGGNMKWFDCELASVVEQSREGSVVSS